MFLSHHQRKVALPPSISTPNPALQAVPALLGLSSSHASYASEPSAQLHFQVSPRHGFHQGHKPNGLECKGGTQLCRQMFWYVHVSTCSMATWIFFPLTETARGRTSLLMTFLWVPAWSGGWAVLGSTGKEERGECGGPCVRAGALGRATPAGVWVPRSGGPLKGLSDR